MQTEADPSHFQNHYVLCGLGSIGGRIARELIDVGKDLVIIDNSEDVVAKARERGYCCMAGDAESEEVLLKAGLRRAHGLILTLPDDRLNVFVTLIARELCKNLFILTRANYSYNRRKLLHAGADNVVAPEAVGADRMAQVVLHPVVDRFTEHVLKLRGIGVAIDQVRVRENAPLAGKTLAGSQFRSHFDTVVLGVWDHEAGQFTYNPGPDTRLKADDILIVIGSGKMVDHLRTVGCTPG